jgi:hypothetical protein
MTDARREIDYEGWDREFQRGMAFYMVLGLSREDAEARARIDNMRHFYTLAGG